MKFTQIMVLLFVICPFVALADDTDQKSWSWKNEMETLVISADKNTHHIAIGSYGDKEYRKSVFEIFNKISLGWSDSNFQILMYKETLLSIFHNSKNERILKDELITLQALTWLMNLQRKYNEPSVEKAIAFQFFIERVKDDEALIKDAAITGLGVLQYEESLTFLKTYLLENENNFWGERALDSLLMQNREGKLTVLRELTAQLTTEHLKLRIKRELSQIN